MGDQTPGPWKIDFGHPRGLPGGISQEGGKPVTRFNAFARPATDEALANAHLIAAAPDLLAALERAVIDELGDNWKAAALAAIAKSKGSSNG